MIYQHLHIGAMIASITDGLVRTKQVYVTFASLVIGKTRKMEIFAKNVAVVKQALLVQLLWSIVIATMAGVGKHQRILVLLKAYVYLAQFFNSLQGLRSCCFFIDQSQHLIGTGFDSDTKLLASRVLHQI